MDGHAFLLVEADEVEQDQSENDVGSADENVCDKRHARQVRQGRVEEAAADQFFDSEDEREQKAFVDETVPTFEHEDSRLHDDFDALKRQQSQLEAWDVDDEDSMSRHFAKQPKKIQKLRAIVSSDEEDEEKDGDGMLPVRSFGHLQANVLASRAKPSVTNTLKTPATRSTPTQPVLTYIRPHVAPTTAVKLFQGHASPRMAIPPLKAVVPPSLKAAAPPSLKAVAPPSPTVAHNHSRVAPHPPPLPLPSPITSPFLREQTQSRSLLEQLMPLSRHAPSLTPHSAATPPLITPPPPHPILLDILRGTSLLGQAFLYNPAPIRRLTQRLSALAIQPTETQLSTWAGARACLLDSWLFQLQGNTLAPEDAAIIAEIQRELQVDVNWHDTYDDTVNWALTLNIKTLQCRKYATTASPAANPSSKNDGGGAAWQGGGGGMDKTEGNGVMHITVTMDTTLLTLSDAEWRATEGEARQHMSVATEARLGLALAQRQAMNGGWTLPIQQPVLQRTIMMGTPSSGNMEVMDQRTDIRIERLPGQTTLQFTFEPSDALKALHAMAPEAQYVTLLSLTGRDALVMVARSLDDAQFRPQVQRIIRGEESILTWATIVSREYEEGEWGADQAALLFTPAGVLILPPARVEALKPMLTIGKGVELPTLQVYEHQLFCVNPTLKHCLPYMSTVPIHTPPPLWVDAIFRQLPPRVDLTQLGHVFLPHGVAHTAEGTGQFIGAAALSAVTCHVLRCVATAAENNILLFYECRDQILSRFIYVEPQAHGNVLYCILNTEFTFD